MAKVYGIAAGSQGYSTGDIFEATAWRDGGATEPELAQDLDELWVEVLGVFVAADDEIIQGSYDFLDYIPRVA